jgi:hypothetical protein
MVRFALTTEGTQYVPEALIVVEPVIWIDPGGQAPKAVTPRSSTAPINKTQFSRFTFSLLSIVPKPITFSKIPKRAKAWDHPLIAAWPEPVPAPA